MSLRDALCTAVGGEWVRTDDASLDAYGQDALRQIRRPDVVVLPADTAAVAKIAAICHDTRTPLVPRGAGTGYSGGAVPVRGGVVISLERLNRILTIDERSMYAVVQPHVVTGALQAKVESRGLFYPPDPASLDRSVIGGNVAEGAGGPRAFKYGTTKRYVLGLEAVLPTGDVIRTGSHTVKNVVGYDLTQLIVGSEGTLAIVTEIVLRLLPKPRAVRTLQAAFADVAAACDGVAAIVAAGVTPSALELVDRASLDAVRAHAGVELAPAGTGALLLLQADGGEGAVAEDVAAIERACREAGAVAVRRAADADEAERLWQIRRELSPSLRAIAPLKLNHDVVVPVGEIPKLFELAEHLRRRCGLRIACFGHAGDGNIHVNFMVDPGDGAELGRAHDAERLLFEGVVALGGAISGEHGIGYTKAPFLRVELPETTIALMKALKRAFDPHGILNPGKIFPD
ncbi:MAG: FAD-binding oxidoreductase [Betaproteobacteria bacterium]